MTMSYWGIHYERTQTWWEETKPWHEYLTRCQYLLQKGLFVADILYMQAEAVPNRFIPPNADFANPMPPDTPGYNFDGCTADVVFNRISIKDGLIILPDGMSYQLMVLPSPGEQVMAGLMTIKLANKIEELVKEGMVIVGLPPVKTPGLSNYPNSEIELKQIIDRLWGDTSSPGERKVVEAVLSGVIHPKRFCRTWVFSLIFHAAIPHLSDIFTADQKTVLRSILFPINRTQQWKQSATSV
jgi:hypothetical protein